MSALFNFTSENRLVWMAGGEVAQDQPKTVDAVDTAAAAKEAKALAKAEKFNGSRVDKLLDPRRVDGPLLTPDQRATVRQNAIRFLAANPNLNTDAVVSVALNVRSEQEAQNHLKLMQVIGAETATYEVAHQLLKGISDSSKERAGRPATAPRIEKKAIEFMISMSMSGHLLSPNDAVTWAKDLVEGGQKGRGRTARALDARTSNLQIFKAEEEARNLNDQRRDEKLYAREEAEAAARKKKKPLKVASEEGHQF